MTDPSRARRLVSGVFTFDRMTLELFRHGTLVKLQPQPARLLARLLATPGDLVTREELRAALWSDDVFVDVDQGLNFCIRQLRTAFDDSADAPRFIETLRGRGYRFIAPVERLESGPGVAPLDGASQPVVRSWTRFWPAIVGGLALIAAAAGVGVASRQEPAIGLSGFEAASSDATPWAAALRSEVLARLARDTTIPVVDLTAGGAADVSWQVAARVDRGTGRHRVAVVLRDRDGAVRWSDVFESTAADALAARAELSQKIAFAVRLTLEGPGARPPAERLARRPAPGGLP